MTVAPYRVHKLIQDLLKDPAAAAAFVSDPGSTFAAYNLTEEERAMLRDGTPEALHCLGVHPNLQMKYKRLRSPAGNAGVGEEPLAAYLDRLQES